MACGHAVWVSKRGKMFRHSPATGGNVKAGELPCSASGTPGTEHAPSTDTRPLSALATPVAEIEFEGRTYYRTGKVGTDRRTGAPKAEYSCHEPGLEHRAWANYDGTNPEAE